MVPIQRKPSHFTYLVIYNHSCYTSYDIQLYGKTISTYIPTSTLPDYIVI